MTQEQIKQKALDNPGHIIQCTDDKGNIILAFKIAFSTVEAVFCKTEEDIPGRMMDLKDDIRFHINELQNINYEIIKI